MTYQVFSIQAPGQPATFEYPSLNPDFSLRLDHLDGEVVGPITASAVANFMFDELRGKWVKQESLKDVPIVCLVTEARFAFVCRKYDKGQRWFSMADPTILEFAATVVSKTRAAKRSRGKCLAGHLRYPWISHINFDTKRGWLSDELIRLHYESGVASFALQFTLDKHGDAASLAHTLMQRVVAYNLVDTSPKNDDELRSLADLVAAGSPPPAAKNKLSGYQLPWHFKAGAAARYAPPAPPSTLQRMNRQQ